MSRGSAINRTGPLPDRLDHMRRDLLHLQILDELIDIRLELSGLRSRQDNFGMLKMAPSKTAASEPAMRCIPHFV